MDKPETEPSQKPQADWRSMLWFEDAKLVEELALREDSFSFPGWSKDVL